MNLGKKDTGKMGTGKMAQEKRAQVKNLEKGKTSEKDRHNVTQ